jgi:hypothetical protein
MADLTLLLLSAVALSVNLGSLGGVGPGNPPKS